MEEREGGMKERERTGRERRCDGRENEGLNSERRDGKE